MSAVSSGPNDAGLLMELLSPKPRSPLNNSLGSLGRSGSLRRSRNSPSSSPSVAADRELNTLLGIGIQNHKVAQQRGAGEARTASPSASPERVSPQTRSNMSIRVFSFPQTQQPLGGQLVAQTPDPSSNEHNTTANYLNDDATQTHMNAVDPIDTVTDDPSSDFNQESDHNNNSGGSQVAPSGRQQRFGSRGRTNEKQNWISEKKTGAGAAASGSMAVLLEKHTLVPELRAFNKLGAVTGQPDEGRQAGGLPGGQGHLGLTEGGEQEGSKSQLLQAENTCVEESDVLVTSSSQKEEEEGGEDEVVVWCVTGVCEAAGERTHTDVTQTQTENNQCGSDNQAGSERSSFASANHTPSVPQQTNGKPVPVPISSQPVPVSRCEDSPRPVSSTRRRPAGPVSSNQMPPLTADASEKVKESANQVNEPRSSRSSTNQKAARKTVAGQSADDKTGNQAASCPVVGGAAPITSGKNPTNTRNITTSKSRPAGIKPPPPNSPNKGKPVRTLTSTENQSMRRVVPISRTSRGAAAQEKHPERSPGQHRGSFNSLTTANLHSTSVRRGERPSTAPTSRRSSIHKTPDPKDSKDQKVPGTRARELNQPSIRKPLTQPKLEEKICRSTLQALTRTGNGGAGGSTLSAPATPLHKATAPSSCPGFARSTASSSFRRTRTSLAPPRSPQTGSDSSFKTSSSSYCAPPTGAASSLTQTSSLRVHSTPPSLLTRTPSIRLPPRPPIHNSLAPRKGHKRNDSGSFSDQSSQSRDSGKTSRPGWR